MEKVNFDQLKKDVADQERVRKTYQYFNATKPSQHLFDESIKMGENVLANHEQGHDEQQAMVDLVDQSIYNSRKALNGPQTDMQALTTQLVRSDQFLVSQEFTELPSKTQQYWQQEVATAHQLAAATTTDQQLADQTALKLQTMFTTMEQMRPQLAKEVADQRAAKQVAAAEPQTTATTEEVPAAPEQAPREKQATPEAQPLTGARRLASLFGFHK